MSSNKIIDPRISVIASGLNQPYAAVRKDLLEAKNKYAKRCACINARRDRVSIVMQA